MENEWLGNLNESFSIESHHGVEDLPTHFLEAGLAVFYFAKVNNLPGIFVVTNSRSNVNILVLDLPVYSLINWQTDVAGEEILRCNILLGKFEGILVLGFILVFFAFLINCVGVAKDFWTALVREEATANIS